MYNKKLLSNTEYGCLELEEGILLATWKAVKIDINTAKAAIRIRLDVTKGERYPALIKIASIKDSTKEARDFLASEEGCRGLIAGAIILSSIVEEVMASLYIYLNKPIIPTKIFRDEIKAKKWLAHYLVKAEKV